MVIVDRNEINVIDRKRHRLPTIHLLPRISATSAKCQLSDWYRMNRFGIWEYQKLFLIAWSYVWSFVFCTSGSPSTEDLNDGTDTWVAFRRFMEKMRVPATPKLDNMKAWSGLVGKIQRPLQVAQISRVQTFKVHSWPSQVI